MTSVTTAPPLSAAEFDIGAVGTTSTWSKVMVAPFNVVTQIDLISGLFDFILPVVGDYGIRIHENPGRQRNEAG